jgi:squalene cyclase
LAIADGVAIETEEGKVKWWCDHEMTLPSWSTAVKKILLVQPSSASAERVFSLLQNVFNRQQDATLEEIFEVSVILKYNNQDG